MSAPPRPRPSLPDAPFLYPIIDAAMMGETSLADWVLRLTGPGRAALVQWRFKGLTDHAAASGARELRAATRATGALLIINDRPDIARMVDADGVHVGQEDLDPADVRALLPDAIIGVSTHNREQFEEALGKAVDYIAVGPVFTTGSKENPDPVVGLDFVSWARTRTKKTLVAIGGITVSNGAAVVSSGADAVAVISEVMRARAPQAAATELAAALRLPAAR